MRFIVHCKKPESTVIEKRDGKSKRPWTKMKNGEVAMISVSQG